MCLFRWRSVQERQLPLSIWALFYNQCQCTYEKEITKP